MGAKPDFINQWFPSPRGLPRAFWIVCLGMFVNRAGGFVAPFLSLYLTDARHLTVERAGALVSLVGFGSLAAGPVGGHLADRLGRRPAMALATLGSALAMLALGVARAESAIAAAAMAVGCFGEMYRAPGSAIIADVVPPEDRARAFGFIYWAVNLGFAFASAVAGLVAGKSYPALFIGDAATTLAMGLLVVLLVHETRPATPPTSAQESHFFAPYRHGTFVGFLVVSLLLGMLFMQIGSVLPMDLKAHGIDARTYGGLLALNGIMIGLLQPTASVLTRRFSRARVLAAGAALAGLGLGVNALVADGREFAIAAIVVFTIGEITMAGLSPTVVSDVAPPHLRGGYQGAFQLSFGLAASLGPLGGSYLLQHAGPQLLWRVCIVVGLLAAAGYLAVVPERHPVAVPQAGVE